MRMLRKLMGLVLGFVSFLAGGMWGCGAAAYGVEPPPHDPTVTLDDFSYTPPSPVNPGDRLEFTATTNKPTGSAWLTVLVGDPPEFSVMLNDKGIAPDSIREDGIWHGEIDLPLDASLAEDLPTIARLSWQDGFPGQEVAGEDLTIVDGDA